MRHSDKNNGMGTTDGNGILCDMYIGVCTASWLLFVVFSAWRMGFLFYFLQWTFYGYGHSITYNNWLRTLCSCLCFFFYTFLDFYIFLFLLTNAYLFGMGEFEKLIRFHSILTKAKLTKLISIEKS